ncbi:MAG: hypothetical protein DMG05_21125, partial [Acidobacteria bacterium]
MLAHDTGGYVFAEADDFNRKIELARQNKKLMKFLDLRSKQTNTVPLEEVKVQLGLHRESSNLRPCPLTRPPRPPSLRAPSPPA